MRRGSESDDRSRGAGQEGGRDKRFSFKMAWAVLLLCAVTMIASSPKTVTSLVSFNETNGAFPEGALIQGTDGDLYGTTVDGGINSVGTIFKMTTGGTLTSLHSFDTTDGSTVYGGLVQATNGNFYGTTYAGGANGAGTVFQFTPGGTLTTLHSFDGTDGSGPRGGVIEAGDGDLYGTTEHGGANDDGTIFKITLAGTLTTLHNFDATDGLSPIAGVIQATDGSFYGTTAGGGASSACTVQYAGCGTVFKITQRGTLTTLHSFIGSDGAWPTAGLVQSSDGDFYGATSDGGGNNLNRDGTAFKITSAGSLTTLYTFHVHGNGAFPIGGLVEATDKSVYGTTESSGGGAAGTIYQIDSAGALTTIHSFNGADGFNPLAAMVQDTDGNLYGTTNGGGAHGLGTVFSLSLGLGPFVKTQPRAGEVGAKVSILGTDLTVATGVTFNGVAAAFTVVSPSLITTTVPSGAATGKVHVKTHSGTLSSNVVFVVQP